MYIVHTYTHGIQWSRKIKSSVFLCALKKVTISRNGHVWMCVFVFGLYIWFGFLFTCRFNIPLQESAFVSKNTFFLLTAPTQHNILMMYSKLKLNSFDRFLSLLILITSHIHLLLFTFYFGHHTHSKFIRARLWAITINLACNCIYDSYQLINRFTKKKKTWIIWCSTTYLFIIY